MRKVKAEDRKEENDEGTFKFEDVCVLVKEKVMCNAISEKHYWATSNTASLKTMLMTTFYILILVPSQRIIHNHID